jgi:hypothetical protein
MLGAFLEKHSIAADSKSKREAKRASIETGEGRQTYSWTQTEWELLGCSP